MTSFPDIAFNNKEVTGFISEEATVAINETAILVAISAIIAQRNLPACLFISYFIVSVARLINRSDFSSDCTILITAFISSSEINKVNLFPALTAPCPLIFLSNVSHKHGVDLAANLVQTSLVKGTAKFNNAFFA